MRADHPGMGIVVISDRGNGFALELLRADASRVAYLLDERPPASTPCSARYAKSAPARPSWARASSIPS